MFKAGICVKGGPSSGHTDDTVRERRDIFTFSANEG